MGRQIRMTASGQVTLPDDVRATLGLAPGDVVAFEREAGSFRILKGAETEPASFEDRLDIARARAKPLPLGMTTDEYMSWVREPLTFDET